LGTSESEPKAEIPIVGSTQKKLKAVAEKFSLQSENILSQVLKSGNRYVTVQGARAGSGERMETIKSRTDGVRAGAATVVYGAGVRPA
jgi:hypothetical protein